MHFSFFLLRIQVECVLNQLWLLSSREATIYLGFAVLLWAPTFVPGMSVETHLPKKTSNGNISENLLLILFRLDVIIRFMQKWKQMRAIWCSIRTSLFWSRIQSENILNQLWLCSSRETTIYPGFAALHWASAFVPGMFYGWRLICPSED